MSGRPKINQRIPDSLRTAVYQLFRVPPLRETGRWIYRKAAGVVVDDVRRIFGVESVYWRGGAIESCLPAVSDIDLFVILSEEARSTEKMVLRHIRSRYQRWKIIFPMLGEVVVLGRSDFELLRSEAHPYVWPLQVTYKRDQHEWRMESFPVLKPFSLESRLLLAYRQYILCLHRLAEAARVSSYSYRWPSFRRDVRKLAAVLDLTGENFGLRGLAEAFCEMERLFRTATLEVRSGVSDSVVNSLNKEWVSRFKKFHRGDFAIEPTSQPFVFLILQSPDEIQTSILFDLLYEFLQAETKIHLGKTPVLLTPSMFAFRMGKFFSELVEEERMFHLTGEYVYRDTKYFKENVIARLTEPKQPSQFSS